MGHREGNNKIGARGAREIWGREMGRERGKERDTPRGKRARVE